jgi:hypothetical protein
MPREDYLSLLRRHMGEEKIGRWRDDRQAPGARADAERRRLAA